MEDKKTVILNTRTFEGTKKGLAKIGKSMKPKVKASSLAHEVLTDFVNKHNKNKR